MVRGSLVVVAVAVLTACGSTLPSRTQGSGNSASLGSPNAPTASLRADGGATPSSAYAAASPAFTTTTTGNNSMGLTAITGSPAPPAPFLPAPAALGTLPPASPITVGYLYTDDEQAVASQLGIKGFNSGSAQQQFIALERDVNKRGGILGHRVVLVGHNYSTAGSLNDPAGEGQKACADFVQDHHVFAVLTAFDEFLTPCLTQHGVYTVGASVVADGDAIAKYRYIAPATALDDLFAPAFIGRLAAQGYFAGWDSVNGGPGPAPVKIGLIHQDLPSVNRYYRLLKRALAANGLKVNPSDEIFYQSTGSGVAAASSNAVLKFRSDGVTHVFGAALFFFEDADSQHYRPRYAMDSKVPLEALAANVGASQLHGTLGVGFTPAEDVDAQHDPGAVSPLQGRCEKLMSEAGVDWRSARATQWLVLVECDELWSLAAALEKGDGVVSPGALVNGFASLGTVPSAVTFSETWSSSRFASARTVADVVYEDGCTCFAYTKARTSF